jgi:hypothetical protein
VLVLQLYNTGFGAGVGGLVWFAHPPGTGAAKQPSQDGCVSHGLQHLSHTLQPVIGVLHEIVLSVVRCKIPAFQTRLGFVFGEARGYAPCLYWCRGLFVGNFTAHRLKVDTSWCFCALLTLAQSPIAD